MPQPPYTLVIDQGGHSTRAFIFDSRLAVVAQAQARITTHHPRARFVEHDPVEISQSFATVLTSVCDQLAEDVRHIQFAGLACQRSSIVCWHKQSGEALSPVISWQDTRGVNYLDTLQSSQTRIQDKTGLRLSPHYGASKMRWCLEHLSEVRSAHQAEQLCIGPLATWLVVQLTGNPLAKADAVNAARTSLMNLTEGQWDEDLCALFNVPRSVLPGIADNNARYGEISLDGNKVPLCYVTGDQNAALFATGQPGPDVLYVNIGSGAFLQRLSEGEFKPVDGLLNSLVERVGQRQLFSLEATINGAANALDWLAEQEHVDVLSRLDEWLQQDTEALFINAVGGLAAPWWRDDLGSRFIGGTDTRSHAIAVIESVVFLVIVNMERMAGALPKPKKIIVSGGLSRLDGLCSRLAILADVTVYRMQDTEATALGLARRLLPGGPRKTGFDEFLTRDDERLLARYRSWLSEMKRVTNDGW
jgi:glycerol kinase